MFSFVLSHSQITHLTQDTIWETFRYGVLGQVWYLIVWIPDLCLLHYFYLMYTYAKFDQNIPSGSRSTQWAFSLKEHDWRKWCSATHCHLFAYFSLTDHRRMDGQTLQNMQIEIINNNNILKTWNRNFARSIGVHYKHCVCLSIHSFSFDTLRLAPDTD